MRHKPDSVTLSGGDHLSMRPEPGIQTSRAATHSLFGLAPGGACTAGGIAPLRGGLLPRLFTLAGRFSGGLFSAALSFPRNMVRGILLNRGLPALRSPDFPPRFHEATAAGISQTSHYTPHLPEIQLPIDNFLSFLQEFFRNPADFSRPSFENPSLTCILKKLYSKGAYEIFCVFQKNGLSALCRVRTPGGNGMLQESGRKSAAGSGRGNRACLY